MRNFCQLSPLLAGSGLVLAVSLLASPVYADDIGTTIAATLNKQWKSSTVENCAHDDKVVSALTCSGVLLKSLPDSDAEKKMRSGGALFLRQDMKSPQDVTGVILSPDTVLNANEKTMSAACVRPVAVDNNIVRDAFGCGEKATTPYPVNNNDTDVSTCNRLIPGPTADNWEWNNTCSLSVLIHQEFSQAILLNKNPDKNPYNRPVQIWYRHWPESLRDIKPLALVYTDDGEKAARLKDRAGLMSVGMNIPVLRYTPEKSEPFSYNKNDDDTTSAIPTIETAQKKLDKLFAKEAAVEFLLVPPSLTIKDHTVYFPEIDANIKAVKWSQGYTQGSLTLSLQYHEVKNLSPSLRNLNSSAILYGFIVDSQSRPMASVYGPYGSSEGRRAAVALAKQFNSRTRSMLPVAMMNVNATYSESAARLFSGDEAFHVILAGNEAEIQPGPDDGTSLEDKANKVIARYGDIRSSCTGGAPAWQCSGLIMRATGSNHPFTQTEDVVKNRGVASYSYLRQDTNMVNMWGNNQAIIIKVPDSTSASTQVGKEILNNLKSRLKCIYPHDADTVGKHGVVKDFQCHKPETSPSEITSDYSDCATVLKLPANTPNAEIWVNAWNNKHFTISANQCSFSVQHAGQFYAATKLTAEKVGGYTWNELILAPSSDPNDIPALEAVLYKYHNNNALKAAKEIAEKYRSLRNITLPLIGWKYDTHHMIFESDKQI